VRLTQLAIRSKAVWGYDAEFMARCRTLLEVTPEYIANYPVFVGEDGRGIGGFCSLRPRGSDIELDLMFVEPARIGEGLGAVLFRRAVAEARTMRYATMLVESDPGAEAFYLRMGARRIGDVASNVLRGRFLPLLAIDLQPGHTPV
jgi:GNAT superfamily N-acetyltransferase